MKNCWVQSEQQKESLDQWLRLNDFRLSRKAKKASWPLKSVDGPLRLLSFASTFKSLSQVPFVTWHWVTQSVTRDAWRVTRDAWRVTSRNVSLGRLWFFKRDLKLSTFSLNMEREKFVLRRRDTSSFYESCIDAIRWSLCIRREFRRSLSLCGSFTCQESIPC